MLEMINHMRLRCDDNLGGCPIVGGLIDQVRIKDVVMQQPKHTILEYCGVLTQHFC